jgi:hypothetical protein
LHVRACARCGLHGTQRMLFVIAGVAVLLSAGLGAGYYYYRKRRVNVSDSYGPMLG